MDSTGQFTPRDDVDELVPGLRAFRNPTNKFVVLELHYTADPAKRSPAWRSSEQRGIAASDWAREYELSWVVRTGRPVYTTVNGQLFDRSRHVFGPLSVRGDLALPTDGRLVVGYDTGPTATRMGASFNLFQPSGYKWTIDEIFTERASVAEFMDAVMAKIEVWEPYSIVPSLHVVDPTAIETESFLELKACADVMRAYGVNPIPGERTWTARKKMVEDELEVHRGPVPRYNVHERCVMHIDGFEGGYHLKAMSPSMGGGYSALPVKNGYSEIHDALAYAISRRREAFQKVVVFDTTKRINSYAVGGRRGRRQ